MLREKLLGEDPWRARSVTLIATGIAILATLVFGVIALLGSFLVSYALVLLLAIAALAVCVRMSFAGWHLAETDEEDDHFPEASPRTKYAMLTVLILAALLIASSRAIPMGAYAGFAVLVGLGVMRWLSEAAHQLASDEEAKAISQTLPESVSGLVTAGIMIMLSYTFALEAFRIPTGSMEPTLYSDPMMGERVLVNKLDYELTEPARGDIAVFRYPLSRNAPYVKRVAGLPHELIVIHRGDVYYRKPGDSELKIWRKSGRVREAMWFALPGIRYSKQAISTSFSGDLDKISTSGNTLKIKASDTALRYPKAEGDVLKSNITDHNVTSDQRSVSNASFNKELVGDFRLVADVDLGATKAATLKLLRGDSEIHCVISDAGAHIETHLSYSDTVQKSDATKGLVAGASTGRLEFGVADGHTWLKLDGVLLTELSFETRVQAFFSTRENGVEDVDVTTYEGLTQLLQAVPKRNEAALAIEVREGELQISNFQVDRDLQYRGRSVDMPYATQLSKDEYFALGDNSSQSLDSRLWHIVELGLSDGTTHQVQIQAPHNSGYWGFIENLKRGSGEPGDSLQKRRNYASALLSMSILELAPAEALPQEELTSKNHTPVADLEALLMDALAGNLSPEKFDHDADASGLLRALMSQGGFQSQLEIDDIYGIRRSFPAISVTSVKLKHVPGVPANLLTDHVWGSVWPLPPSYVD